MDLMLFSILYIQIFIFFFFFFFQAEDGIRDIGVTGVQTCALPISLWTLQGLHALESAQVEQALQDSEAGVRKQALRLAEHRSEERRVGKECRSRWSRYH